MAIKHVVRDVRQGRNLEPYVLASVALVVALTSIFGVSNRAVVDTVILMVLAYILYGQARAVDKMRSARDRVSPVLLGFGESRADLVPLRERMKQCRNSLQILAVQLGAWQHEYIDTLSRLASEGRRVEILLLNPLDEGDCLKPWLDEVGLVHTLGPLTRNLLSTAHRLHEWHESLKPETRANIDIRWYSIIPTYSVVALDANDDTGWIQVEPCIFGIEPASRPNFTVTANSQTGIRIREGYGRLWADATKMEEFWTRLDSSQVVESGTDGS